MKKFKTVFAAAALLFATSAFATSGTGPEKVTPKVKAVFEKNFTHASDVNWEKKADFYFASFKVNATQTSAAYNENGELVGMSREIKTAELPLNVSVAISNRYEGYTLDKIATELTYDGVTSYYVTVENNKQILRVRCSGEGDFEVTHKTKK